MRAPSSGDCRKSPNGLADSTRDDRLCESNLRQYPLVAGDGSRLSTRYCRRALNRRTFPKKKPGAAKRAKLLDDGAPVERVRVLERRDLAGDRAGDARESGGAGRAGEVAQRAAAR